MIAILLLISVAITSAIPLQETDVGSSVERIVTDFDDVIYGVPIDYRYNESSSPEGGLASAPGCPKSDVGYPWVHYKPENESSPKCYLAGQGGPCDYGQKMFLERGRDPLVGFCNCECFEDVKIEGDSTEAQFCTLAWMKEVVFLPDAKKCYLLYEQGPCKDSEWLVKTEEAAEVTSSPQPSLIICEERRCPKGQILSTANSNEGNNGTLQCIYPFHYSPSYVGQILENDCPDSTRYSHLLKQCVKTFTFVQ